MNDLVFKILCKCLYQNFYGYEGFSILGEEIVELEKILVEQFRTDPDYYSKILRELDFEILEERWRWFISQYVELEDRKNPHLGVGRKGVGLQSPRR